MALTDKLTAIAEAIRAKTGGTTTMTLDQMPTEIAAIQTGGGGFPATMEWTAITPSMSGGSLGCNYGNGVWIAWTGSKMYRSGNGIDWVQIATGLNFYQCPVYANGVWVASITNTGLYYSMDNGTTWTASNKGEIGYSAHLIEYANGMWYAASNFLSNKIFYSEDGKTWNTTTMGTTAFSGIKYANGVWMSGANGNGAGIFRSEDGIVWNKVEGLPTTSQAKALYFNGVWFAYLDSVDSTYVSTDNGVTWTENAEIPVCYSWETDGRMMIARNADGVYRTTDGVTFETIADVEIGNIGYSNGVWFVSPLSGMGYYYSGDGINWKFGKFPIAKAGAVITTNGNTFVAMVTDTNYSRKLYYSVAREW